MGMRLPRPGRRTAPEETTQDPAPAAADRLPDPGVRGTLPTAAPAPSSARGRKVRSATHTMAIASAELLLIVLAVVVVGYVLGKLWVVLLPVVLGLLIATVLWPPTRLLRRHGWP